MGSLMAVGDLMLADEEVKGYLHLQWEPVRASSHSLFPLSPCRDTREAVLPRAGLRLLVLTPTFPHSLVPLQSSWAPTPQLLMLTHLLGWVVASTRCQREP